MSIRTESKYANHERLTWFGFGSVCYVDFTSATESYCVMGDGLGSKVAEPDRVGGRVHYFPTFDEAVAWALEQA